jgi:hypothetical protein
MNASGDSMISFDTTADAYRITIHRTVNGNRIRKTKRLPRGVSFETATKIAAQMDSGRGPLQERLYQATVGRPNDIGSIYLIKHSSLRGLIKIGMTRSSVHSRRNNLGTAHPGATSIVFDAIFRHVELVERHLHEHFKDRRAKSGREYFAVSRREAIAAIEECLAIDGYDLSEAINAIGRRPPCPPSSRFAGQLLTTWTCK